MSVKEVLQALGSWGVSLKPQTPRELIREIERNKFGHIAIIPGRINPSQYNDGLLRKARYVGVYRSTFKQSDDTVEIKGVGMAFWLGDEDGKGDVFETPIVLHDVTFPNAIRALLPSTGSVEEGTLYSVPGAGLYSNTHNLQTPREAITYVTETFTTSEAFSGVDRKVEYRVNGDATLDAGPIEDLYVTTPRAILVKKDTGRDMRMLGLQADMSLDYDVEDLTTRVVLLAQGEGQTITTATADSVPPGYLDLFGNPIKMTRLISESGTLVGNAATRAQIALTRWTLPRQAIQISTQEFDIKGDFSVGDFIYVFDPESGFFDLGQEAFWRGQPINPLALRVKEMDWGVRPGWTVAFRKNNGEWLDLSEYYKPEGGQSTLAVGDYRRTLAGNNYEPISFRPNLPEAGSDTTIPAAPVFTEFSTGSYESDDRTLAAIYASWAEPLNVDGSTLTDGDHYEVRYRPNAIIGTATSWDFLSGDYGTDELDTFDVPSASGWPGWTTISASPLEVTVSGGVGQIAHPSFNLLRGVRKGTLVYGAVEVLASFQIDYDPLTASTVMGVVTRGDAGFNNCYYFRVEPNADLSVSLKLTKYISSSLTELAYYEIPGMVHTAGQPYWLRVSENMGAISAKVWQGTVDDEPERETYNIWDTDPILANGYVGVMDWIVGGSTVPLGSATKHPYFAVRSLTPDNTAAAYDWDSLGSWDALTSEIVATSPNWQTAYIGWDANEFTLLELSPGVQYELQIRAVDSASPPNVSTWSPSSFVNTSADAIAPSTPAAPEVAASMIAVQIVHNLGKASGGTFNLENDLARLEVHCAGDSTYYPDAGTKVGEIAVTGMMVRAGIQAVGSFKVDQAEEVWVRVVAVDRSGNKSAPSIAVQSTIVLIDDAHISDLTVSKITAGTIAASWVMAGEIKTADTGARVMINSAGIQAYDILNRKTVDIDATDGSATFTGVLQTTLDDAGVAFFNSGNNAYGYWQINDASTGDPMDHRVIQKATDLGSDWGQGFEQKIVARPGNFIDGAKTILSELVHIVSHQPDADDETYLALGGWPNPAITSGGIYMQGKFNSFYTANGQGALFCHRDVIGAGFGGAGYGYGATMEDFMCPIVSLTGVGGDAVVVNNPTSVGFGVVWNGAAAHTVYAWAFRMDS